LIQILTYFDITPKYIGGSLVKMTKRLKTVKVFEKGSLFREYRLAYQNDGTVQRSHLVGISECGSKTTCFEPTIFEWQKGANGTFQELVDTPSISSIC
jgi:hypothetical protein